ncbi:MucR family transcriptional regulator [Sphingomonas oryzagri]
MSDHDLIALTADIVSAHVSNNSVPAAEVAPLIQTVYAALEKATAPAVEEARPEPVVPVRASVKHDYIVCLEDGKKLKMLKRYLRTNYAMSPEEYRTKWGLPRDYPMVAPAYAEQRKELAKKIGLGRKPAQLVAKAKPNAKPKVPSGTEALEKARARPVKEAPTPEPTEA